MVDKVWYKHWPKGLLKSLDYPEVPVSLILKSAAVQYPDKEAFVFLVKLQPTDSCGVMLAALPMG